MSLELLLAVVFLCYFLFYTDSFAVLLCFAIQFNPLTFAISSSSHSYIMYTDVRCQRQREMLVPERTVTPLNI